MVFISDIARNQSKQSVKGEILQQQSRINEGQYKCCFFSTRHKHDQIGKPLCESDWILKSSKNCNENVEKGHV